MKDVFGFDLFVGDTVAFVDLVDNSLTRGTIIHILPDVPVKIHIKYRGGYTNKYPNEVAKRVLEPDDLKLLKFTLGANQ